MPGACEPKFPQPRMSESARDQQARLLMTGARRKRVGGLSVRNFERIDSRADLVRREISQERRRRMA